MAGLTAKGNQVVQKLALDTNSYTAYGKSHKTVIDLVDRAQNIGLPIIVLGELYFGFENGSRCEQNLTSLNRFLQNPRLEILQINQDTARGFGEIATELERMGKRVQQNDVWIAALCKQYGYTLCTGDTGFLNVTGLETLTF